MRYFINNHNQVTGPFRLDELKGQLLRKDTMVWYSGLEGWTKANEILELLDLLIDNPANAQRITPLLYNTKQLF